MLYEVITGIVIPQQVKKNNEFSGNLLADAKLILNLSGSPYTRTKS